MPVLWPQVLVTRIGAGRCHQTCLLPELRFEFSEFCCNVHAEIVETEAIIKTSEAGIRRPGSGYGKISMAATTLKIGIIQLACGKDKKVTCHPLPCCNSANSIFLSFIVSESQRSSETIRTRACRTLFMGYGIICESPRSHIGRENLVATAGQHPGSL